MEQITMGGTVRTVNKYEPNEDGDIELPAIPYSTIDKILGLEGSEIPPDGGDGSDDVWGNIDDIDNSEIDYIFETVKRRMRKG